MHALAGEMLARDGDVLGGHADARAALHGAGPVVAAPRRDRHAAARDAQVDRLVEPGAAMLEQHVLAGHAQVRRAPLHVGRNVGGPHDHQRHARHRRRQHELARRLRILGRHDARGREQRQRLVEDAALRQGDRERHGAGHSTGGVRGPRRRWAIGDARRASRDPRSPRHGRARVPSAYPLRLSRIAHCLSPIAAFHCLTSGAERARQVDSLVRNGLMSSPPRRVKRASTASLFGRQAASTSTKMRSTQCSWKPACRR